MSNQMPMRRTKTKKMPKQPCALPTWRAYIHTPTGWRSVKNRAGYPIAYASIEAARQGALYAKYF